MSSEYKNSFYLYLPSSIKGTENTLSHYTTQLQSSIVLPSFAEYECALTQIIYPQNLHNIYDGSLVYHSITFGTQITAEVPTGTYNDIGDVIAALYTVLSLTSDNAHYVFSVNKTTHKVTVELIGQPCYLELSKSNAIFKCNTQDLL